VLTVAVADKLLHGGDYVDLFHEYFHAYPHAGYGGSFIRWAGYRRREPYNSWGNGSAMRVSPVGVACDTLESVLEEAKRSDEVTHNHPEGIRGALTVAAAVLLARTGHGKDEIREFVERQFGYNLSGWLDGIRKTYTFDVSSQGSVPQSIIAFLESTDYEDAVRDAISLGGDDDIMACIAGGITEGFYGGMPQDIQQKALELLDDRLRCTITEFYDRFGKASRNGSLS